MIKLMFITSIFGAPRIQSETKYSTKNSWIQITHYDEWTQETNIKQNEVLVSICNCGIFILLFSRNIKFVSVKNMSVNFFII